MITESDSFSTIDIGKYYVILPSNNNKKKIIKHLSKKFKVAYVRQGFKYNSGTNDKFLTVKQLRNLIKDNIN